MSDNSGKFLISFVKFCRHFANWRMRLGPATWMSCARLCGIVHSAQVGRRAAEPRARRLVAP